MRTSEMRHTVQRGFRDPAGMRIVAIGVDARGEIDIEELKAKATEHADKCAQCSTDPSAHLSEGM